MRFKISIPGSVDVPDLGFVEGRADVHRGRQPHQHVRVVRGKHHVKIVTILSYSACYQSRVDGVLSRTKNVAVRILELV